MLRNVCLPISNTILKSEASIKFLVLEFFSIFVKLGKGFKEMNFAFDVFNLICFANMTNLVLLLQFSHFHIWWISRFKPSIVIVHTIVKGFRIFHVNWRSLRFQASFFKPRLGCFPISHFRKSLEK